MEWGGWWEGGRVESGGRRWRVDDVRVDSGRLEGRRWMVGRWIVGVDGGEWEVEGRRWLVGVGGGWLSLEDEGFEVMGRGTIGNREGKPERKKEKRGRKHREREKKEEMSSQNERVAIAVAPPHSSELNPLLLPGGARCTRMRSVVSCQEMRKSARESDVSAAREVRVALA